ncbi:hypothetical protein SBV1_2170007 [Verrucomicrobia bacterium]|nr:hypothetical protein SBV1_2170007 [Verrucomicrobiota bacterium]
MAGGWASGVRESIFFIGSLLFGRDGLPGLLFGRLMGFVGEHPLLGAAAATSLLAADFLGRGSLRDDETLLAGLELIEQQAAGEKAVEALLSSGLALNLQAGRAMEQHDTGSGFIHILAAVAAGAHKGLLEIRLAQTQQGHAFGQLIFFFDRDRKGAHERSLAVGHVHRKRACKEAKKSPFRSCRKGQGASVRASRSCASEPTPAARGVRRRAGDRPRCLV